MQSPSVAKRIAFLCAVACVGAVAPPAGADGFSTPPGMACEDTILIRYHAGPRWADVQSEIAAHLDFMRAQMRAGRVLFGGPFYESGGLDVVRGSDIAAASAIVDTDPLVAHHVVTYSAERFWMCRPAGAVRARSGP